MDNLLRRHLNELYERATHEDSLESVRALIDIGMLLMFNARTPSEHDRRFVKGSKDFFDGILPVPPDRAHLTDSEQLEVVAHLEAFLTHPDPEIRGSVVAILADARPDLVWGMLCRLLTENLELFADDELLGVINILRRRFEPVLADMDELVREALNVCDPRAALEAILKRTSTRGQLKWQSRSLLKMLTSGVDPFPPKLSNIPS